MFRFRVNAYTSLFVASTAWSDLLQWKSSGELRWLVVESPRCHGLADRIASNAAPAPQQSTENIAVGSSPPCTRSPEWRPVAWRQAERFASAQFAVWAGVLSSLPCNPGLIASGFTRRGAKCFNATWARRQRAQCRNNISSPAICSLCATEELQIAIQREQGVRSGCVSPEPSTFAFLTLSLCRTLYAVLVPLS